MIAFIDDHAWGAWVEPICKVCDLPLTYNCPCGQNSAIPPKLFRPAPAGCPAEIEVRRVFDEKFLGLWRARSGDSSSARASMLPVARCRD